MEYVYNKYRSLLNTVSSEFQRFLMDKIDWSARAICIMGARGTGKSTLMLQHIKRDLPLEQTLYVSLDDLYFRQHSLSEVAESFYSRGGRYLFIDEAHKYKDWESEVKTLYDFHPELHIRVSGSSIMALNRSEADLSRRMLYYLLPEMSFREYIALSEKVVLPTIGIDELLQSHASFVDAIREKIKSPLALFDDYLPYGAYPFFREGKDTYFMRIQQLINVIIDYDLPEGRNMEVSTQAKLKLLLYVLSTSVPYKPNIAKLAEQVHTSRIRLLEMLDMLERAQLIRNLRSAGKGGSLMNKPEKIFLNNTSLVKALAESETNVGNLRETFLHAQLSGANLKVSYPKVGDFLVNNKYVIEVGGKGKSARQIKATDHAFLALDGIEYGTPGRIPLWLFGFLY